MVKLSKSLTLKKVRSVQHFFKHLTCASGKCKSSISCQTLIISEDMDETDIGSKDYVEQQSTHSQVEAVAGNSKISKASKAIKTGRNGLSVIAKYLRYLKPESDDCVVFELRSYDSVEDLTKL